MPYACTSTCDGSCSTPRSSSDEVADSKLVAFLRFVSRSSTVCLHAILPRLHKTRSGSCYPSKPASMVAARAPY